MKDADLILSVLAPNRAKPKEESAPVAPDNEAMMKQLISDFKSDNMDKSKAAFRAMLKLVRS